MSSAIELGGEFTLLINGEPSRILKVGDGFYVPPNVIHQWDQREQHTGEIHGGEGEAEGKTCACGSAALAIAFTCRHACHSA